MKLDSLALAQYCIISTALETNPEITQFIHFLKRYSTMLFTDCLLGKKIFPPYEKKLKENDKFQHKGDLLI